MTVFKNVLMNFKSAGLRNGCHKCIAHLCHAVEVSLVLPRIEHFLNTLSFTPTSIHPLSLLKTLRPSSRLMQVEVFRTAHVQSFTWVSVCRTRT